MILPKVCPSYVSFLVVGVVVVVVVVVCGVSLKQTFPCTWF